MLSQAQAKQLIHLASECQRLARAARLTTDQVLAVAGTADGLTQPMIAGRRAVQVQLESSLGNIAMVAKVANLGDVESAVQFAQSKVNSVLQALSALNPGAAAASINAIKLLDDEVAMTIEGVNALVTGSAAVQEATSGNIWTRLISGQGAQWSVTTIILLIVGVITIVAIWAIQKGALIPQLAQTEIARGLITFLLSGGTILIALLLVLNALFLGNGDAESEKRFTRGKEILTALLGVFGTILGFYFGSAKGESRPEMQVSPIALARNGTHVTLAAEVSGGSPPYKFGIQFKKPVPPPEPVTEKETKEGKIMLTFTNLATPAELILTVTDRGTNRIAREFKEQ